MHAFYLTYTGHDKGLADKLRSILAQFQFKYEVELYAMKGILFNTYLYVPEEHPETKATFYEREDKAHLIKVCRQVQCITYYVLH